MLRTTLTLTLTLIATGCASTAVNDSGDQPATTSDSAPSPDRVAAVEVTLVQERLTIDEVAGTATLAPNTRRKATTYTRWVFDLASFKKVVRLPLQGPTKVKAIITSTQLKTRKVDPRLSQPIGGFRYVTHQARVLSVAP